MHACTHTHALRQTPPTTWQTVTNNLLLSVEYFDSPFSVSSLASDTSGQTITNNSLLSVEYFDSPFSVSSLASDTSGQTVTNNSLLSVEYFDSPFSVSSLASDTSGECMTAQRKSKGGSHGWDTSGKASINPAFQSALISLYLGHYHLLTCSWANWKQYHASPIT